MESETQPSIEEGAACLVGVILSSLLATLTTSVLAAAAFEAPNIPLIILVSSVFGLAGSLTGEPIGDALIRTLLTVPFALAFWYADCSDWMNQLILSIFVSVGIGGISHGLFRAIAER